MKSQFLRYAIPLPLVAMASVNAWLIFQIAGANAEAIRHYTRVPGTIYSVNDAPRIDVELPSNSIDPAEKNIVTVRADSLAFVSQGDSVTLYLNPTDKSRSRLGGVWSMWLTLVLLGFESLVLLAAAGVLWTLNQPRGWVWCSTSPEPELAEAVTARYPRSNLYGCLFWSVFGLATAAGAYFVDLSVLKRTTLIYGGLTWFFLCMVNALHVSSYRVSANRQALKVSSALVSKTVGWDRIKHLEDNIVRTMSKPTSDWRGTTENIQQRVRYVRIADWQGNSLFKLSRDLDGSLAKILEIGRLSTGLSMEKKDTRLNDWGS